MGTFNLSANIETGFSANNQYIVTPNAKNAIRQIVNDYHTGIHSFTIIGTYGTGKSSFLLALEADLKKKSTVLFDPKTLNNSSKFEIINIVGDYIELSTLLQRALGIEGNNDSIIDGLRSYYQANCQKQKKSLVLVIDEFGKVLEHAAKNNPEKELYFLQKLAEFVNVPSRQILLLTTLHQNFGAYSKDLTESQKNEWIKVKGRFKEVTFVEPVEQLLVLASERLQKKQSITVPESVSLLYKLARSTGFISTDFQASVANALYPLDVFSAYAITKAIQRYGQNERSLFSFLEAKGTNSISEFKATTKTTYNLASVFDYITYNFYSYLNEANTDSLSWSSMQVSIERVEGHDWESKEEMLQAVQLVKAIGLLNLFGVAGFKLETNDMVCYAKLAIGIDNADQILKNLENKKIIRFAAYKNRLQLFEGTDVDLEAEFRNAGSQVPRPVVFVDDLKLFFNKRISPVKAHFYQRGTPRFFDYLVLEEPMEVIPDGDTDGYIELIFSTKRNIIDEVTSFSIEHSAARIYAVFKNTDDIIEHLYNIKKYTYLQERIIDKEDRVASLEVRKLKEYEESLLNKAISDNLFAYRNRVVWIFGGKEQNVKSHRDFNVLLSHVCDEIYSETPIMNNELFNKHKLSSSIASAKKNYLNALTQHWDEQDLGFPADKFPPEKTIYFSLLKNTGLHSNGDFADAPTQGGITTVWNACENFLKDSEHKARKISELIKRLSTPPYKLKQGFLDFWIPTYLFIRRQDYALFDASRGAYMPEVNMTFFDLLQKHPGDFEVKKFAVDGVKLGFFNQYRRFVNLGDEFSITNQNFIETIKPFVFFYANLNDYTKHTRKFDHQSTLRFRDVLASAKDPEKAFFEDLPEALGFDALQLKQEKTVNEYGGVIQRAIRELRACYGKLLDRIEERLVDGLGLNSGDYQDYVIEIRERLAGVKTYLLTNKQREFYNHVITEYDNRTMWYQSICYTVLDKKLDTLRDEQEDKLVDDLIYLFRECEKCADISLKVKDDNDTAFSFDLVSNRGTNVRTQTYILPEKEKKKVAALERRIDELLSGDKNLDICTLLSMLNKKMNS